MKPSPLRNLLIAATCAAALTFTTVAFAEDPGTPGDKSARHEGRKGDREHHARGPRDHTRHLARLTRQLGLTAEQQASIKPILEAADARRKAIWENTALAPRERRSQGREVRESVNVHLKGILTPEQQRKFEELKEQRRGHGRRHKGPEKEPPAK